MTLRKSSWHHIRIWSFEKIKTESVAATLRPENGTNAWLLGLPLDTPEEGEQQCLRCLSINEPSNGLSLPASSRPVQSQMHYEAFR
jgi:hypothetical protein